jgi:Protein of unknown function (DUF3237)
MNRLRRELLDWNLLYLFSFDIELDLNRQEKLGRFSEGVRLNLFAKDGTSRVYNVGRQSTTPNGNPAISGRIEWGGDEALLRDDDVGACNIRLAIHTDDQQIIHLSYRLQGYLGPGGVERVVSAKGNDRFGTEEHPYEIPIITSPRFQTPSPRYAWLNELQGVGFGRVQTVRSKFRRNTQDVYALQ